MNTSLSHKKIAIVHDWLVVYGGAEKVLENIIDLYPNADIFSLVEKVPENQRVFLRGKIVKTSFLQRLPYVEKYYRYLMPILPFVIEQFDFGRYDLVITSSYCVSKGILTGPQQLHISYCHSPVRYAWDQYHHYISRFNNIPFIKFFMRLVFHYVRLWDVVSSNSVDQFIATSRFVASRIKKYYRRPSIIIHPPVDLSTFNLNLDKKDYYIAVARFVPFKRLDIAVKAFSEMPEKQLLLVGDGPDMGFLKNMATSNVKFIGFQNPEVVMKYLSRARALIFPSEEDFGIVPLEAQATGTPVIAYGKGGILDTVIPHQESSLSPTGVFFYEQNHKSLVSAISYFEDNIDDFNPDKIANHACNFTVEKFKEKLDQAIYSMSI
ncbi:MAG: glycosyltransferase family 4 protein [Synechococcus sp. YX04-3]|nr:MAG: glycosyltransferase family 4 protein [Synechococcus sp. YX04-3]